MWAFYLPLFLYFLWNGLKNKHFFFFTNVNRGYDPFGGLFLDDKVSVMEKIPAELRAKSRVLPKGSSLHGFELDFDLPIVLKPVNGERGKGLIFIENEFQLQLYGQNSFDEGYIIEEYIDLPCEFGIFTYWNPDLLRYKISSITEKRYFKVKGDGYSTLNELILKSERGMVFYDEIISLLQFLPDYIPKIGEILVLHTQGNHSKGTEFINRNSHINERIEVHFNAILKEIEVFEYGRFDIKCKDWGALEGRSELKIIEFNGISAEPTHIYDSKNGFFHSLSDFAQHWNYLEDISKYRLKQGIKPQSVQVILKKIWIKCLKNNRKFYYIFVPHKTQQN